MNQVFKDHPNLKKYYQTADGTKFFQEDHAKTHARSLEDRTVKTVNRPSAKDETEETTGEKSSKPKASAKSKAKASEPAKPKAEQKPDDSGTVDSKDLNPMQAAKLRKEAIEKIESIAEVEKALEGETAASVIKAGNERIAALKATEALDSKKENDNVQTQ